MKDAFLKIASFGIKPHSAADIAEQIRLVNGISFMGIPVCLSYIVLFSLTGYYNHALCFVAGFFLFAITIFFTKWVGLNFSRAFINIMASVFFASVSVILGKDLGFYLGLIVVSVPAIIVFPSLKQAFFYVANSITLLILSVIGSHYIEPLEQIPFAMAIFLMNLFVVLITTLTVVIVFKLELNESREKLFERNKEMTDSINYAKKIQTALLAHNDILISHLKDHFVLFKPKDIVSGDFYWATEQHNKFYLAVCDSTGHGVPGAFMSLLNIGFLNEAIKEKNIEQPHEVLNYVRRRLVESISKEGQKDGMDGILISMEKQIDGTIKVSYSGANNAPVLVHQDQYQVLKTDKMPVGKGEKEQSFNLYTIDYLPGDTLYLFTDGYADQFGGSKGKKFKYKPLYETLQKMSNTKMNEQCDLLNQAFDAWRGSLEQVDDVAVIGIRL